METEHLADCAQLFIHARLTVAALSETRTIIYYMSYSSKYCKVYFIHYLQCGRGAEEGGCLGTGRQNARRQNNRGERDHYAGIG